MCTVAQYDKLLGFLNRGPWKTERKLMSECLHSYPSDMMDLTQEHADEIIKYCMEVVGEGPEGVCVDLWTDDEDTPRPKIKFKSFIEEFLQSPDDEELLEPPDPTEPIDFNDAQEEVYPHLEEIDHHQKFAAAEWNGKERAFMTVDDHKIRAASSSITVRKTDDEWVVEPQLEIDMAVIENRLRSSGIILDDITSEADYRNKMNKYASAYGSLNHEYRLRKDREES